MSTALQIEMSSQQLDAGSELTGQVKIWPVAGVLVTSEVQAEWVLDRGQNH